MAVITEIDIFCSKSKRTKYVPLQSLEVIKVRLDLYGSLEKLYVCQKWAVILASVTFSLFFPTLP